MIANSKIISPRCAETGFYGGHRMFLSSWFQVVKRTLPASRQVGRRPRSLRLHCEELELRLQPSAFAFSLSGQTVGPQANNLAPDPAANGGIVAQGAAKVAKAP